MCSFYGAAREYPGTTMACSGTVTVGNPSDLVNKVSAGAGTPPCIITLQNGQYDLQSALNITRGVKLVAATAGLVTLDAQNSHRVVSIDVSQAVELEGLVIQGGGRETQGGGIYIKTGDVVLNDVTLSNNAATTQGGGLCIMNGKVRIINSRITGNTAGIQGGGIFQDAGELTLSSSTVSGNSASTQGGGLFANRATTQLVSSTVSGNTALMGSGMFNNLGAVTLDAASSIDPELYNNVGTVTGHRGSGSGNPGSGLSGLLSAAGAFLPNQVVKDNSSVIVVAVVVPICILLVICAVILGVIVSRRRRAGARNAFLSTQGQQMSRTKAEPRAQAI